MTANSCSFAEFGLPQIFLRTSCGIGRIRSRTRPKALYSAKTINSLVTSGLMAPAALAYGGPAATEIRPSIYCPRFPFSSSVCSRQRRLIWTRSPGWRLIRGAHRISTVGYSTVLCCPPAQDGPSLSHRFGELLLEADAIDHEPAILSWSPSPSRTALIFSDNL